MADHIVIYEDIEPDARHESVEVAGEGGAESFSTAWYPTNVDSREADAAANAEASSSYGTPWMQPQGLESPELPPRLPGWMCQRL